MEFYNRNIVNVKKWVMNINNYYRIDCNIYICYKVYIVFDCNKDIK